TSLFREERSAVTHESCGASHIKCILVLKSGWWKHIKGAECQWPCRRIYNDIECRGQKSRKKLCNAFFRREIAGVKYYTLLCHTQPSMMVGCSDLPSLRFKIR